MLRRINSRSRRLFIRLMLVLFACILPLCVLSLISNSIEQRMLFTRALSSQETSASFCLSTLEQEVSRLKDITYSYMNDKDFQKLALIYDTLSDYDRVECILNVQTKLSLIRQISHYVANIYVYLPGLGRSVNAINSDYELTKEQIVWYFAPENLSRPILNNDGRLIVCSYYIAQSTIIKLPAMLLAVELDKNEIRTMLRDTSGSDDCALIGEDWCISTETNLLASSEYMQLHEIINRRENTSVSMKFAGENYLFTICYSQAMDASVVTYLPLSEIQGGLIVTQRLLWLVLLASVAGLTGTTFGIYRMVHIPMRRLVDAFEQVENGNGDVRLTVNQKDEFQYLYKHFNRMMDQLNSLIHQVYTQKILSQQSELKQLQMQINPHFFYNSFFAINGMLEMGDVETAERMLNNIGEYFRFITRNGRDVVPLEEEVAHARSYCEIQKIRFENIEVNFAELPEEIRNFQVPRLILQPLIENAYIYGLENKVGDSYLSVYFQYTERVVTITVEDDGGGMGKQQLDALREMLCTTGHGETTGMLNIHKRLKLFFGESAGITLIGNENNGLTLVIIMPRGGREYAQTSNC